MRFCLGISKNWRIDITRCFIDWHWLVVDYLVSDVIETWKELAHWCPS
jgi:hypothetical protein